MLSLTHVQTVGSQFLVHAAGERGHGARRIRAHAAIGQPRIASTVLMLLDDEYLMRFWTSAEAWLAMQSSAEPVTARAHARAVQDSRDASVSEQRGALIQLWMRTGLSEACSRLNDPGIKVTNQGDKQNCQEAQEAARDASRSMGIYAGFEAAQYGPGLGSIVRGGRARCAGWC